MKTRKCHVAHPTENVGCTEQLGHEGPHHSGLLWWPTCSVPLGEGHTGKHIPADGKAWTDSDPVNHPKHYTSHPSGIECIDVTRHMNFNRGNAIKYIWRAGEKGPAVEDLKKAIWYLQDEIKRLSNGGD